MTVTIAEACKFSNQSIKQASKQAIPGRRAAHEAHPMSSRIGLPYGCFPSQVGCCIPSPPTSQQVGVSLWFWLSSPSLGSRTLSWTGIQHLFWPWTLYKSMVILRGRDRAKKIRHKICQTARNELEIVAVSPGLGRESCLKGLGSCVCCQLRIMTFPGAKRERRLFKITHDLLFSISFNWFKGHGRCSCMGSNTRM